MARQRIKLTMQNGDVHELVITPKVEVTIERELGVSAQAMQEDMHAEHLYRIAFLTAKFAHKVKPDMTFDEFLDDLVDLDQLEVDLNGPDPTRAVPAPGNALS